MSVLVDTSIWSLALRREPSKLDASQRALIDEWRKLVVNGQACLAGPIRQEILSGIADEAAFRAVQQRLTFFDDLAVQPPDYDQAAMFYNVLRSAGIAGAAIDLLLCALAQRCDISVFTTNRDFERYAAHLPIRLHQPRRSSSRRTR